MKRGTLRLYRKPDEIRAGGAEYTDLGLFYPYEDKIRTILLMHEALLLDERLQIGVPFAVE